VYTYSQFSKIIAIKNFGLWFRVLAEGILNPQWEIGLIFALFFVTGVFFL
jgi:hypothetical protein